MRIHGLILVCGLVVVGFTTAPAHCQRSPNPPVSTAASDEVRVRPGDQVAVRIDREPGMTGTYTVSEVGEIVLPRLGRVVVADMTPGRLQDTVRSGYEYYLRNPAIEVSVLRRISVQGEVRRPDVYLVDLSTTLSDLLARAGGITEQGNPRRITIVRDGEQFRFDPEKPGVITEELRSGDQILVGRRSWVSLNGLGLVSTSAVAVSVFVPLIRSLLR